MMIRIGTLVLGLGLVAAQAAHAQGRYNPLPPYELNLHAGGFFPDLDDDTDSEGMFGARIMLHRASGWGFGGNFDVVPRDQIDLPPGFPDDDININDFLYSAELDYTFASTTSLRFFVGGGIGARTTRISDLPEFIFDNDLIEVDDTDTDLLVPLAVGLKWYNRSNNPSWGIRIDARDNIIWDEQCAFPFGVPALCSDDTEAENNWELTGGVSIFFGE